MTEFLEMEPIVICSCRERERASSPAAVLCDTFAVRT